MPKKLDPAIADILKGFGFGSDACWDCNGTWVVYHKILEQIAAKAKITFDPPQVIEGSAEKGVAILAVGSMWHEDGARKEWSFGEASPKNNKTSYPYAMAEKRAKDRVILKLIGLHGLAYSEEEADDFKPGTPRAPDPEPEGPTESEKRILATMTSAIAMAKTLPDLRVWWAEPENQRAFRMLPADMQRQVEEAKEQRKADLTTKVAA